MYYRKVLERTNLRMDAGAVYPSGGIRNWCYSKRTAEPSTGSHSVVHSVLPNRKMSMIPPIHNKIQWNQQNLTVHLIFEAFCHLKYEIKYWGEMTLETQHRETINTSVQHCREWSHILITQAHRCWGQTVHFNHSSAMTGIPPPTRHLWLPPLNRLCCNNLLAPDIHGRKQAAYFDYLTFRAIFNLCILPFRET